MTNRIPFRARPTLARLVHDPFRNGFTQTVVGPFSVRRRPRAPVWTPLDWSEVKPTLVPAEFNISNFHRPREKQDPWRESFQSRQSLKDAIRAVKRVSVSARLQRAGAGERRP